MCRRAFTAAVFVYLTSANLCFAGQPANREPRRVPVRVIDGTTIVGHSDPVVWKTVLDLLPVRPRRVELLDLDSVSDDARRRVRGLDAFVLAGQTTVVVIRQSATLRRAETGDAIDRLALASLIWHELAHADGLDERAGLEREQELWRTFIARGLVDAGIGMAYITLLGDAGSQVRALR